MSSLNSMAEIKIIELTQNRKTIVDESDYPLVMNFKWHFRKIEGSNKGYAVTKIGNSHLMLHHLLLGKKKGKFVDHVNRDSLDNRRSNLRFVTPGQNVQNRESYSLSGYKGVYWSELRKAYRVQIWIKGKLKSLGQFKDAKEAARVWNECAKKYCKKEKVLLNSL